MPRQIQNVREIILAEVRMLVVPKHHMYRIYIVMVVCMLLQYNYHTNKDFVYSLTLYTGLHNEMYYHVLHMLHGIMLLQFILMINERHFLTKNIK